MATILCIDDDICILRTYKALLSSAGYAALTASDGLSGIALARQNSIDLVVLDFNMPGMDGSQVAQVLMTEQPNLPVVMCTSYLYDLPEGLKWRVDALLHKGDGPAALLSTVHDLILAKKGPTRSKARTSHRRSA